MSRRFVSLYYASIGLREVGALLGALATAGIVRASARRRSLAAAVRAHFHSGAVFSYGSARGALSAALSAAGIGPGDDVLLSSFTCLAVPTAVIAAGARPVYSDIDLLSLNATPESIISALTPKVRAIIVQHSLGSAADIESISAIAHERGVLVIEDCALSIGTRVRGKPVGNAGDAAVFSMELSKTISTGWGGVLLVHQEALALGVRQHYASLRGPSFWRMTRMAFQVAISGLCYRPGVYFVGKYIIAVAFMVRLFGRSTPAEEFSGKVAADFITRLGGAQARLGVRQWTRLPAVTHALLNNAARLRGTLHELGLVALGGPAPEVEAVTPRVSFPVSDRDKAVAWFLRAGIELGAWFDGPLSPLPVSPLFNYDLRRYPQAARVARHIVNVPCHERLNEGDMVHIQDTLRRYAAAHPEDRLLSADFASAKGRL